jgi:hypothetical protein
MDSSANKEGLQSAGRKAQSNPRDAEETPLAPPQLDTDDLEDDDELDLDDDELDLDDDDEDVTESEAERADGA